MMIHLEKLIERLRPAGHEASWERVRRGQGGGDAGREVAIGLYSGQPPSTSPME